MIDAEHEVALRSGRTLTDANELLREQLRKQDRWIGELKREFHALTERNSALYDERDRLKARVAEMKGTLDDTAAALHGWADNERHAYEPYQLADRAWRLRDALKRSHAQVKALEKAARESGNGRVERLQGYLDATSRALRGVSVLDVSECPPDQIVDHARRLRIALDLSKGSVLELEEALELKERRISELESERRPNLAAKAALLTAADSLVAQAEALGISNDERLRRAGLGGGE